MKEKYDTVDVLVMNETCLKLTSVHTLSCSELTEKSNVAFGETLLL